MVGGNGVQNEMLDCRLRYAEGKEKQRWGTGNQGDCGVRPVLGTVVGRQQTD